MRYRSIVVAAVGLLISSTAFADAVATRDAVAEYVTGHQRQILDEYIDLLAIPNVASDDANIQRNADHIVSMLEQRGITARLLTLEGSPPVVFGELLQSGASTTVIVYVHYDGQPVQRENWFSEPWEPILRTSTYEQGGKVVDMNAVGNEFDPEWRLYARSTGDDKAPIIGLMSAIDALTAADISRSVNLKFFFDGEEEAGSPHLGDMIDRYKDLLDADLWLFCDGPVHQTRRNLLAFGVRGITGFEVTLYGPSRQLHSGHYGNWAPNPITRLAHLIASMRDMNGKVLIDGFYDDVVPPTASELEAIAAAPGVDTLLKEELGLVTTESDGLRVELAILRPALNLKGINAGGIGDQARNAIADEATATFGVRMVPDQTPAGLQPVIENHIRSQGYTIIREEPESGNAVGRETIAKVEWEEFGYPSVRFSMDDPRAQALTELLDEVADEPLVKLPTFGGSLPLYVFRERLDAPIVLFPIANHDNNQHAANENIRLANLWTAIELYAVIIAEYGNRLIR